MDTSKDHTFISACKDFFGLKEGQTAMQFGKETQVLTPEDRAEIKVGLEALGYRISAVSKPA